MKAFAFGLFAGTVAIAANVQVASAAEIKLLTAGAMRAVVVALPLQRGAKGIDPTGLSADAPGAYAEQVLVQESHMMPVPNGLPGDTAALTEPMAVAWHAVRRGEVRKRTVAIVIGCGPVGLGVILCLKAKGVQTVLAAEAMWSGALVELVALLAYQVALARQAVEHLHLAPAAGARSA